MPRLVTELFVVHPLGCLLLFTLNAQTAELTNTIAQQELKQQQIRASTQRVEEQLSILIAEFRANGIAGEDVARLSLIRNVLGSVSAEDMPAVIEALQKAKDASEPGTALFQALAAYSQQKTVSLKLKALVSEYLKLSEVYELSLRLKEFARRQSELMWRTVELARRCDGKPATALADAELSDLRLLQIDQEPIKDEATPYLKKFEATSGAETNKTTALLLKALDAAIEAINAARFQSAAGDQRTARNIFRAMARSLVLAEGRLAALRQAIAELEQLADTQQQLAEDTKRASTREPRLQTRHAELVDGVDLVRTDVTTLAPLAAEYLQAALARLNDARDAFGQEYDATTLREKVAAKHADASIDIQRALRELREETARAEEQEPDEKKSIAALRDLRETVQRLRKGQRELTQETAKSTELISKASKQGDLKDTAQAARQQASIEAPAAGEFLGQAAAQMHKSQLSLAAGQNNAAAQQAAIEALDKAEQQLAQDIARLQQSEQQLQLIERLLQELVAIIADQQKLQFATLSQAAREQPGPLQPLIASQGSLAERTSRLETNTIPVLPSAASHLHSAAGFMEQARIELEKTAPKTAELRQTDSLKELYAARDELEKKVAELRQALGVPPGDANALADAAGRIQNAQRYVEQALADMQVARLDERMQAVARLLAQAAEVVTPLAAGEVMEVPREAQSALQSAEHALASGAAQAMAGQASSAKASAAAAAQALGEAQAAVALAQAGLASSAQMAGAGQQAQSQGQGQGQASGEGRGAQNSQGSPNSKGDGRVGNWSGPGGVDGPRRNVSGEGKFTGLPARDRAAILQSQGEKYPQEYAPLIEQYLKNLAEQSGK